MPPPAGSAVTSVTPSPKPLRPGRGHRIGVRTTRGARQLDLVAGEDRVLGLRTR
nr:hypothetical protein StreXyl84_17690 [Streptomyces sp. Xyl84]